MKYSSHHKRMRRLKSPIPEVCQTCETSGLVWLSLVGPGTHTLQNSSYVTWSPVREGLRPYPTAVSDDPDDYIWECPRCNHARKKVLV